MSYHCESCKELICNADHEQSGYLEIFVGPMFASKSSKVGKILTLHADVGMKVLYVNYLGDVRVTYGDDKFSTHNSQYSKLSSKIDAIKVLNLEEVDKVLFEQYGTTIDDYHVIGIDETQFYKDLDIYVKSWVNKNKKVYCAGLDGDVKQKRFGITLDLISFSDKATKKNAKCHFCLKRGPNAPLVPAPFTMLINPKINIDDNQINVGGSESYVPVCRMHYNKYNHNSSESSIIDVLKQEQNNYISHLPNDITNIINKILVINIHQ